MLYYELVPERRYVIQRYTSTGYDILDGVFVCIVSDSDCCVLMRCMKKRSMPHVSYFGFGYKNDIYYDYEMIKDNANKAIVSFEKRTLDIILKKIVNEHFQWI